MTWSNTGIMLIGSLGTDFNEIFIEIHTFSFKKMHLKMSTKWLSFCLGLKFYVLKESNQHHTCTDLAVCSWEYRQTSSDTEISITLKRITIMWYHFCMIRYADLGLYSLSGKMSYRQISWSLEAARLGVIIIASLWSLTGTWPALLSRGLSNFRAIGKV